MTEYLRQGDEVVIAKSEGNVCPVFLLKEYLRRLLKPSRPTNWFKLISISRMQPSGVS